jgi:2'-5' RNA ligase
MNLTIPGKSLDVQFDNLWRRFERLNSTTDTMSSWRNQWQRLLTPVNVSFIIPVEDSVVCDYLGRAQQALRPYMGYDPQPSDKLHITLYQVGFLKQGRRPFSGRWSRPQLDRIASLAREYLQLLRPFDVTIGPINAFSNVAIAEVRDGGRLRFLRDVLTQALPRRIVAPTYPLIPHITLGYFGKQPAAPIRNVLRPMHTWGPLSFTVDRVYLTLYYRKPGPYPRKLALQNSVEDILYSLPIGESR